MAIAACLRGTLPVNLDSSEVSPLALDLDIRDSLLLSHDVSAFPFLFFFLLLFLSSVASNFTPSSILNSILSVILSVSSSLCT